MSAHLSSGRTVALELKSPDISLKIFEIPAKHSSRFSFAALFHALVLFLYLNDVFFQIYPLFIYTTIKFATSIKWLLKEIIIHNIHLIKKSNYLLIC